MKLRNYQIDVVNKVRDAYKQGDKNVILRLDCGSGKTVIAADMCISAAKKSNNVLFLVHRKELLDQTYDAFKMFDYDMTNIIKPQKKHIIKFYIDMNESIDNLEFGKVDEHHPDLVRKYKIRQKGKYNRVLAQMSAWMDNGYYTHRF